VVLYGCLSSVGTKRHDTTLETKTVFTFRRASFPRVPIVTNPLRVFSDAPSYSFSWQEVVDVHETWLSTRPVDRFHAIQAHIWKIFFRFRLKEFFQGEAPAPMNHVKIFKGCPPRCLSSYPIYTTLILIPAYVYRNIHTYFPPFPYSYTFIAIFICIVCVVFYIYTYVFVYLLLFPNLNRHLCHGVYWYNRTLLIS